MSFILTAHKPNCYAHFCNFSLRYGSPGCTRTPSVTCTTFSLNTKVLNPFSWCEITLQSSSIQTRKSYLKMPLHLAASFLQSLLLSSAMIPPSSKSSTPTYPVLTIFPGPCFHSSTSVSLYLIRPAQCIHLASCSSTALLCRTAASLPGTALCVQKSHTPRTLQQIFTEQILSLETVRAGMGTPMLDSILTCF